MEIEIRKGDNRTRIDDPDFIYITLSDELTLTLLERDGKLEVNGYAAISIEPRAANSIWICRDKKLMR